MRSRWVLLRDCPISGAAKVVSLVAVIDLVRILVLVPAMIVAEEDTVAVPVLPGLTEVEAIFTRSRTALENSPVRTSGW